MRSMRDESGQALVLTAVSLLVLMGFLALATDVGILFHDRRELQTAADGAAVAAAMEARNGGSAAQITAAANAAASSNGFTNSSNGVSIVVNNPPASGYHLGAGNIEVDISQSAVPTVLMGLFGSRTVDLSTRAVATYMGVSKSCIWLGHASGTDLTIRGSATIIAPSCGIYLNSSSTDSIKTTGNGNTIDSPYIDTPGGSVGSGTPQGTPVSTGTAPEPNPFNTITGGNTVTDGEPKASTACTAGNTTTGTKFSGQIDAGGTNNSTAIHCFSGANVDVSGATLSDGVFVFENGVTIGTNSTFTMNNATLDLDQGVFNEGSNSIFNITAPEILITAPKQWNNGIALLVPPTNTTYSFTACSSNPNDTQELMIQFGSANQTFSGYIYAPNATVTLHDHGGGTTAAGLVASSLCDLSGNIDITGFNSLHPTTSPLSAVTLVE